jgi:hypothetical protein
MMGASLAWVTAREEGQKKSETTSIIEETNNKTPHTVSTELLLELYYSFFHSAHSCVLPLETLKHKFIMHKQSAEPLILVIKYIDSLYTPEVGSEVLKADAHQTVQ